MTRQSRLRTLARKKTSPKSMPSDQSANNIRLGAASNSGGLLRKFLTGKTGYVLAILFATLFTCFAGYRAYSRYAVPTPTFDFSKSGMNDFHNGAYFPSKAFANRINPYASDVCDHYPMSRSVPPYSRSCSYFTTLLFGWTYRQRTSLFLRLICY